MRRMKLKYEDDVPSSTQNDLKLEGVCWSHVMLNATIVLVRHSIIPIVWNC